MTNNIWAPVKTAAELAKEEEERMMLAPLAMPQAVPFNDSRRKNRAGIGSKLGQAAGTAAGGPVGGMVGSALGGMIGGK